MANRVIHILVFLSLATMTPNIASAQATSVFAGVPNVKISEGGVERVVDTLQRSQAVNLPCVISQIGDRYYWASRENKEMVANQSGAFITFIAIDGSGYVRVLIPEMKSAAALMYPSAESFDYVEHLLTGLNSVTYYGVRR
jgi:hypothetical protein